MKYDIQSEISYDIDCLKDMSYCYIVGSMGMRILPLKNQINIHKEFREVVESKEIAYDRTELPLGK